MHPRKALGERIRAALPLLVEEWQSSRPDCLLSVSFISAQASEEIKVSRPALSKHMTDAVHDGRLVEVLVYRTWQVALPGEALPKLYAVRHKDERFYQLVTQRPDSRGADGTSFLTTPDGYAEFLRRQKDAHGKRIPAPRSR